MDEPAACSGPLEASCGRRGENGLARRKCTHFTSADHRRRRVRDTLSPQSDDARGAVGASIDTEMTENHTPADSEDRPPPTDDAPTAADDSPTAADDSPNVADDPPTVATEATASASDTAEPARAEPAGISRRRHVLVDVLIVFTTILAIVGMLSVYANRLLFNPDNWEAQSTKLLQNPSIQDATANYIANQIYAHVNVAGLISSALPSQLRPLADPAAGALQGAVADGAKLALQRPEVQNLWATANRRADEAFISVVNGGKGPVGVQQGVVTLDLGSIVGHIAQKLGLPPSLSAQLPPSIATLTLFKSDQLKLIQDVGNLVRHLALWLTILVPLLYALAIFLARGRRRRTLMTVGFSIVFAGLVGVAIRRFLESYAANSLTPSQALREPIRAALAIGTDLLGQINGAFLLVGAVIVAAAWFAGPARPFAEARRAMAPFMREKPWWTLGIAAGLMVLVFIWNPIPATGTLGGIVVFLVLALFGTEMLRRQTLSEFPDAKSGDAAAALRDWRSGRGPRGPSTIAGGSHGATVADQLEKLTAMRDRGTITADEYDAAKRTLLGI